MSLNIRKVAAGLGLLALSVAPIVAGQFSLYTNAGYKSATAVVPTAGYCVQDCRAPEPNSFATNTGPLGTFGIFGPTNQAVTKYGPIAAGSYSCSVYQYGVASAYVNIYW